MNYQEVKDKLEILRKLHVSYESNETSIFYKKPYNATKLIIHISDDIISQFELDTVEFMSLNNRQGLLIQYNNKLYPFPYNKIQSIEVISNV